MEKDILENEETVTDYGYKKNGVEYATEQEAFEASYNHFKYMVANHFYDNFMSIEVIRNMTKGRNGVWTHFCYRLAALGVTSGRELISLSRKDILKLRGVGPKTVDKLETRLAEFGLKLREEE